MAINNTQNYMEVIPVFLITVITIVLVLISTSFIVCIGLRRRDIHTSSKLSNFKEDFRDFESYSSRRNIEISGNVDYYRYGIGNNRRKF
jgi:hypothetical protein